MHYAAEIHSKIKSINVIAVEIGIEIVINVLLICFFRQTLSSEIVN